MLTAAAIITGWALTIALIIRFFMVIENKNGAHW